MVAALLFGLRDDSRVKMKLANRTITLEQTMMAMMVDSLNYLCWAKTKDATKGKNRPKRLLDILLKTEEKQKDELVSFETPEEYLEYIRNKNKLKEE